MGCIDGEPPMKHTPNRRIDTVAADAAARTVRRSRLALQQSVRWLGFWLAICLPVVYLPLLAVDGAPRTGALALALIGCQLLALLAGRNYTPNP
ncbi:MAG: hypothetical protein J07HN6_01389 [Halonotius sp. J07HN6]|nr:MAG: hypothetical protein J07HN6_01389 [Halonotius sp. J07HN6]ERH05268.1 MAG: hypothetical protein J07HN4v3_00862 [Halonotius sp. J07HN4]